MEKSTAINNRNTVSSDVIFNIVKTAASTLISNPEMSHALPAIMLRGAPGVGKSTIVKTVANELGIGFVDIRLAQMERVDFAGLPSVENGVTQWNVPAFWPRDPQSKGIILLDEITSAPSDCQVAAYSVVLDRRIPNSNYQLPDGWLIVAAGNRNEDGAVAKTMSSALANRFVHFEVEANVEDWTNWAVQHDIHPSVTGFIRYRPNNLFKLQQLAPCDRERGWPSPRSWERVSNMLPLFADNEDVLQKVVYGLIGNQVGVEFMAFHKINKRFDDVLEMMTNPKAKIVIPERADEKHALASAATYLLWNGKSDKDTEQRINGFYRICNEMSSDFCMMMVKAAMAGNSKIRSIDASLKIMSNKKAYTELAKKFSAGFAKQYKI